jgi:transcriptional regulator with XRE-family HTH domain
MDDARTFIKTRGASSAKKGFRIPCVQFSLIFDFNTLLGKNQLTLSVTPRDGCSGSAIHHSFRIKLDVPIGPRGKMTTSAQTTAAQLRAARALVGLSQPELAERSGVPTMTVEKAEGGAPTPSPDAIAKIKAVLEAAGVVFIDAGSTREGGPGIRLRDGMSDETIALDELNASNDE